MCVFSRTLKHKTRYAREFIAIIYIYIIKTKLKKRTVGPRNKRHVPACPYGDGKGREKNKYQTWQTYDCHLLLV